MHNRRAWDLVHRLAASPPTAWAEIIAGALDLERRTGRAMGSRDRRELTRIIHALCEERVMLRKANKAMNRALGSAVDDCCRRLERAEVKLTALQWQIDHNGCCASREGETTYECRADAPCGLCRLRARAERAERSWHAVADALGCEPDEPHTEANVVGRALDLRCAEAKLRRAEALLRDLCDTEVNL